MKITKNLNTYEIEDLYPSCQTDASIRLPVCCMSHGGLLGVDAALAQLIVGADVESTSCRDVTDPVCSSRTIAIARLCKFGGGSVLRQHVGQFGIGANTGTQ
ncbi:hypothetical protein PMI22_05188 [Pseudomonas sp. GM21]|nr:hypothetical protein PMI22_05188 [Pseudomonas sp. GM21]